MSLQDRAPCIVQSYVDVSIVLSSGVTLTYLLVLHPGHPLKHAVDTLVIDFLDGGVRAHAAGQWRWAASMASEVNTSCRVVTTKSK